VFGDLERRTRGREIDACCRGDTHRQVSQDRVDLGETALPNCDVTCPTARLDPDESHRPITKNTSSQVEARVDEASRAPQTERTAAPWSTRSGRIAREDVAAGSGGERDARPVDAGSEDDRWTWHAAVRSSQARSDGGAGSDPSQVDLRRSRLELRRRRAVELDRRRLCSRSVDETSRAVGSAGAAGYSDSRHRDADERQR